MEQTHAYQQMMPKALQVKKDSLTQLSNIFLLSIYMPVFIYPPPFYFSENEVMYSLNSTLPYLVTSGTHVTTIIFFFLFKSF